METFNLQYNLSEEEGVYADETVVILSYTVQVG